MEVIAKDLLRLFASGRAHCNTETCVSLLRSLNTLDNVVLVSEFLEVIAKPSSMSFYSSHSSLIASPTFSDQIVLIGAKYGWNVLKSSLQAMFDRLSSVGVEHYCKFLLKISQHQPSKDLCQGLASAIVSVLANEDDKSKTDLQRAFYSSDLACRDKGFVILLFKCLMTLECNEQLLSFVQVLRTKQNRYPVMDVLAPFCEDQFIVKSRKEKMKGSEALNQLLAYCISSLQASPSRAPPCPSDWSVPVPFSCSCGDCDELIRFLRHPTERQHRFRMSKARRRHLLCQLDSNRCSVTHVTEHVGNPHTLVVTKTRAAYTVGCQKYEKEKATLSRLQALTGASSSEGEPSVKRQKVINLT